MSRDIIDRLEDLSEDDHRALRDGFGAAARILTRTREKGFVRVTGEWMSADGPLRITSHSDGRITLIAGPGQPAVDITALLRDAA